MICKPYILGLAIFVSFLLASCIDPYNINFNGQNKQLIVYGVLTDDVQNPDTLKIQYSIAFDEFTRTIPIESSVKASIFGLTSGNEFKLIEYKIGFFLPPKDFKPIISEKYVLKFTLPDGQQYESSIQQITLSPPILNLTEKFNPQSLPSENGTIYSSANEVFIDLKDTPKQKNFYLWRYIHYERIQFCETCTSSLYSLQEQKCVDLDIYQRAIFNKPYYDYICDGECFDIIKSKQINIFSDVLIDGGEIKNRIVAKIPPYTFSGCLVEIQQMCISSDVFSFYKTLESQFQRSGGLVDTPPEAIIGNIRNVTNPSQKVIGCFGLCNVQKKQIWIDRKSVTLPLAQILGHLPYIEATNPIAAPCKKNANRTPFKPEGWK
jgi:hypothetical protein